MFLSDLRPQFTTLGQHVQHLRVPTVTKIPATVLRPRTADFTYSALLHRRMRYKLEGHGQFDDDDSTSTPEKESSLESQTVIGDVDLLAYISAVCPRFPPFIRWY